MYLLLYSYFQVADQTRDRVAASARRVLASNVQIGAGKDRGSVDEHARSASSSANCMCQTRFRVVTLHRVRLLRPPKRQSM
jgi:hypothetical protein